MYKQGALWVSSETVSVMLNSSTFSVSLIHLHRILEYCAPGRERNEVR